MSVNEARKFEAAKKAAEVCQESIRQLQRKSDTLQESLPGLSRAVEEAGKAKVSALDAFALNSNKTTEQALKVARQANEAAQKAYSEKNELVEATARALKKMESELPKLHTQADLQKRACWQAIADEIKTAIPSEVFESVRRLQVIGSQTGQTRQWILDQLFPNPSSGEHQEITSELCGKHNIE